MRFAICLLFPCVILLAQGDPNCAANCATARDGCGYSAGQAYVGCTENVDRACEMTAWLHWLNCAANGSKRSSECEYARQNALYECQRGRESGYAQCGKRYADNVECCDQNYAACMSNCSASGGTALLLCPEALLLAYKALGVASGACLNRLISSLDVLAGGGAFRSAVPTPVSVTTSESFVGTSVRPAEPNAGAPRKAIPAVTRIRW